MDYTNYTMSPVMQDMLADITVSILRIAKYELSGEADMNRFRNHDDYFFQTNGFAFDLPNMMLHYGFTTIDELDNPPILEYTFIIPDGETEAQPHGRIDTAANQNFE